MSRIEVSFDGLRALFGPGPDALWTPQTLRAVQTLQGLLAGHSLLRRLVGGSGEINRVAPDLDDYAAVYEILRRSRAGLLDDPGDPIIAAMVRRGNLYLNGLDNVSGTPATIHVGREGYSSLAPARSGNRDRPRIRPISLRELADLGNVRSLMTRALVDAALSSNDLKSVQALGLRMKLPPDTNLTSLGRDAVLPLLITWSMKQVRDRFDRLRRQGFIDAKRVPPGNGPWIMQLPEELKPLPSEFQGLPTIERITATVRPGNVDSPRLPPASPRPRSDRSPDATS
jgi:hypothetical protein